MGKCKALKIFSKEFFADILVISILGTLLHFLYNFAGRNLLVTIFSAVNESVWKHIKIAVVPTYIVAIFKMWIFEDRICNLWIALFAKIMSQIVLIPVLFYSYQAILNLEILVLDIAIFYITIIVSEIVESKIQSNVYVTSKVNDIFKYINIFIMLAFVLFTFIPPKFEIFKDTLTNNYGITQK